MTSCARPKNRAHPKKRFLDAGGHRRAIWHTGDLLLRYLGFLRCVAAFRDSSALFESLACCRIRGSIRPSDRIRHSRCFGPLSIGETVMTRRRERSRARHVRVAFVVRYLQQAPVERAGPSSRRLRGCFFSRNGAPFWPKTKKKKKKKTRGQVVFFFSLFLFLFFTFLLFLFLTFFLLFSFFLFFFF